MRNEINQAYHSWFEFVQNKNNKEISYLYSLSTKIIVEFFI